MFPTLGDLINYILHTHLTIPVQTLGLFMVAAFVSSYFIFKSEFKRKEAGGLISSFTKKELIGSPASVFEIVVNGLLGFAFGYKVLGTLFQYKAFIANPRTFILSARGSVIAGLIVGAGFAFWIYRDRQKHRLAEPKLIEKTVHPYQLMPTIVVSVAIAGFIGAKLFDVAEHLDMLRYDPWGVIFSVNGFAYLGGLIFGALTYLVIGYRHGMKLVHLADIGSPGMMLAYGVGRIGCALSGDGDWGIVNASPKPHLLNWLPGWAWSYNYPHNEANLGVPMAHCTSNYCWVLPKGVFPTSLYEVVLCLALFGLMWALRKHIKTAGLMFYMYLLFNGGERFLIEIIRVNIKYKFLGISLSQAQWLSVCIMAGGLYGMAWLAVRKWRHPENNSADKAKFLQFRR